MSSEQTITVPQVLTASGPGSRITVVCAECKRLKLKCDRRNPCGSCVKRDAVSRCAYSAAAAERIDLQSLHNRITTLEATIQSLVSAGFRRPDPQAEYERTVLATGSTGSSSIIVSLEDVASVWLDQLGILKDADLRVSAPDYTDRKHRLGMAFPDMSLFFDASRAEAMQDGDEEESEGEEPHVTVRLLQQLPDRQTCEELLDYLEMTMRMHPSFNFPNFRRRVQSMLNSSPPCPPDERPTLAFFAAAVGGLALGARTAMTPMNPLATKHSSAHLGLASSPDFAPPDTPTYTDPATGGGVVLPPSSYQHSHPPSSFPGAPPTRDHARTSRMSRAEIQRLADAMFMLSKQALAVSEFEQHYDLDFISAVILNGLFLLHDGKPRVAHTIYPTVGKLVNICRMMGLHIDPDDFSGRYSLFDAEERRRMWWDVYYYDVFISDSMGQDPLIEEESYTTRLPSNVDEDAFTPSSTSLPPPRPENNSAFFIQKCSLAQLVKTMRRRWVAEQPTMEMWLEAASEFEEEVNRWLDELPPEFRMPSRIADPELLVADVSPYVIAQRSELAAMANSLILKAYTPLLKKSISKAASTPASGQLFPSAPSTPRRSHHETSAQNACSQAAHVIVNACHDLFTAFGGTRPANYVFYAFGRQIFAAAAISASIVIQTPRSLVAEPAMKDLQRALDLMRDPVVANANASSSYSSIRPPQVGEQEDLEIVRPLLNNSLRVVEMLHAKASEALAANTTSGSASGSGVGQKRKRTTGGEVSALHHGFEIPFVGSSLVTSPTIGSRGGGAGGSSRRASTPPPLPDRVRIRPRTSAEHQTPSTKKDSRATLSPTSQRTQAPSISSAEGVAPSDSSSVPTISPPLPKKRAGAKKNRPTIGVRARGKAVGGDRSQRATVPLTGSSEVISTLPTGGEASSAHSSSMSEVNVGTGTSVSLLSPPVHSPSLATENTSAASGSGEGLRTNPSFSMTAETSLVPPPANSSYTFSQHGGTNHQAPGGPPSAPMYSVNTDFGAPSTEPSPSIGGAVSFSPYDSHPPEAASFSTSSQEGRPMTIMHGPPSTMGLPPPGVARMQSHQHEPVRHDFGGPTYDGMRVDPRDPSRAHHMSFAPPGGVAPGGSYPPPVADLENKASFEALDQKPPPQATYHPPHPTAHEGQGPPVAGWPPMSYAPPAGAPPPHMSHPQYEGHPQPPPPSQPRSLPPSLPQSPYSGQHSWNEGYYGSH